MTADSSLLGIVLAAGKGSRIQQLPTTLPKPVLPVLGKPILGYQLEIMAQLGIRTVYVVVGYRGFEVVRELERHDYGLTIHYVEQESTLGIAHCVGLLEPLVDRPFLLFLGDIYLEKPRVAAMVEAFRRHQADAVLGTVIEEDEAAIRRNYCAIAGDDGRIVRVVEKPRFPTGRLKGVGVYLFSPVIFDATRRTPRTAMRDEYEITESIQIMINDGHHVRSEICVEKDINITFPPDLLAVNLRLLAQRGKERFIDEGAEVAAGARLQRVVVGRGVRVPASAELTDCLILPGVNVPEGTRARQAILFGDGVFPCGGAD